MYDVIHVGAAAPEIPEAFFKQLRPGGRLILPGEYSKSLTLPKLKKIQISKNFKKIQKKNFQWDQMGNLKFTNNGIN